MDKLSAPVAQQEDTQQQGGEQGDTGTVVHEALGGGDVARGEQLPQDIPPGGHIQLDPSAAAAAAASLAKAAAAAAQHMQHMQHAAPPPPAQQPVASSSGLWGSWGATTSWGLAALGDRLQEVAAGAVRELKSSVEEFQAALVEVPGGTTATDTTRAGVGSAVADASVPAQDGSGTEAFGASEDAAGSVVDSVTEQLQQQQAAREHGDRDEGTAAESSGRVAQPEAAPTAGDGGAAQAAMNAAAATTLVKGYLSRLERGLESVGRSALVYLEEVVGASVVGGGAGAGAASDGDAALALEGTAVGMVGASAATAAANDATEGEARGAGSAPAASSAGKSVMAELAPPCSFEEFLSLYGGRTAADDLLALSRACMETCERARPALGPEGQAALDELLALLQPKFEAPLTDDEAKGDADSGDDGEHTRVEEGLSEVGGEGDIAGSAGPAKDGSQRSTREGSKEGKEAGEAEEAEADAGLNECWEEVQMRYDPVRYMVSDSLNRCAAVQRAAGAVVTQGEDAQQQDGKRGGASAAADGEVAEAGGGLQATEQDEREESVAEEYVRLRGQLLDNAAKRLAQLSAGQVQILLDLGASLAGPAQLPGTFQALAAAAGDMPWPPTSTQQATLLRRAAALMAYDMRRVLAAYTAAALLGADGRPATGAAPDQPCNPEQGQGETEAQQEGQAGEAGRLHEAGQQALYVLHEAFVSLVHCVAVRYATNEAEHAAAATADAVPVAVE